jgi:Trk K+ transport system NAD-binding subunit
MRFLVDEDVPESATDFLRERGHEVVLVVEELMPGAPDVVIARLAHDLGAIVVTCNAKHFKRLIPRAPDGQHRFRRASRLTLECPQPWITGRIVATIGSIESEWEQAQGRHDHRLLFQIHRDWVLVER